MCYLNRTSSEAIDSPSEWFRNTTGLNDVMTAFMKSWDAARAARPALYFIDEIDGLPDRSKLDADRLSWWAPLLDAVLLALSGGPNSERDGLVICAATNHPDKLDPALVRPGRLGRLIEIAPPDAAGLAAVLRHHLGTALAGVDLVPAWTFVAEDPLDTDVRGRRGRTEELVKNFVPEWMRHSVADMDLCAAVSIICDGARDRMPSVEGELLQDAFSPVSASSASKAQAWAPGFLGL